MTGKKKTRAQLETELTILRKSRLHEGIVSIANNLVQMGGLVAIAYFLYCSVDVLSGQATVADIGIQFFGDIHVSQILSWGTGVGGVTYGWRQRNLRRDTVERLQNRIQQLEASEDPYRSTSGLTTRGTTNPKDN